MAVKYRTPKIEDLFGAGVHIGHQARKWHPKMEPYLYSVENRVHVFDLEQTQLLLKEASDKLFAIASKGGQIIFVGTKRQAGETIKAEALRSGALYVAERWLGGTITNFGMIRKNMNKLVTYLKQREDGTFAKYTKKERLLLDREIEKLEKYVGGIVNLKGAPSALFVVDPRKEKTAVREAQRSGIPVFALIDSNSDPTGITHIIPGNDDAIKSISVIVSAVADAVEEGYKEFAEKTAAVAKEAAELAAKAAAALEKEKKANEAKEAKEAAKAKETTSEKSTKTEEKVAVKTAKSEKTEAETPKKVRAKVK